jgi:hypothetical protein
MVVWIQWASSISELCSQLRKRPLRKISLQILSQAVLHHMGSFEVILDTPSQLIWIYQQRYSCEMLIRKVFGTAHVAAQVVGLAVITMFAARHSLSIRLRFRKLGSITLVQLSDEANGGTSARYS